MHLFLTGPKGVGKSTLVTAILAAFPGRVGGFRTVRRSTFLPGQHTVHLLPADGGQKAGEENLLFICKKQSPDAARRFDTLGRQALERSRGADILLMDELGPHEGDAAAFQAAVWAAIEGPTPILGVLQEADAPFLKRIADHPQVFLHRVTEENRDDLAREIHQWISLLQEEGGRV